MRKEIFKFTILFISVCIFTSNTFAQNAPGGGGDGIDQPCPASIKIMYGTCSENTEIRVSFNKAPSYAPSIVTLKYNGQPVTGITLPINGDTSTLSKGYISYCTNIKIPANKLKLEFHYSTGQADCILTK